MSKQNQRVAIVVGVVAVLVAAVLLGKGTLFQGSFKKPSGQGPVSGGPAPVVVTREQCQRIAAQLTLSWIRGVDLPGDFNWNAYDACWRNYSSTMVSVYSAESRVLAEVRRCGEIRRLEESGRLPSGRNTEAQLCRTAQPEVWQAPNYAQCQTFRRSQEQGVGTRKIKDWDWRVAGACYRVYGL